MKNITITVDDETYRRARVRAAEHDTSVSALVRQFLTSLDSSKGEFDRLARDEKALRERIRQFSAGNRASRDELYGERE